MPRTAARKDYTLFVMCDSWIGADRVMPLKLKASSRLALLFATRRCKGPRCRPLGHTSVVKDLPVAAGMMCMASLQVAEKSRAEREGRAGRAGRVIPLDEYGNPEEGARPCPPTAAPRGAPRQRLCSRVLHVHLLAACRKM